MSEPSSGALAAGQIFHGRYEIVRCIKAGGMGAVYECIHLATRKHRAIKVMLPQIVALPEMRERFELEARATAEIESEHIVETFDAGVDGATSSPFLVMELLRGEDLATTLRRRGALSAQETLLLLSQAALALDKTHAAGIVHRDLKPENLIVTTRDDGSPRLKILDFGIAKMIADVNQTTHQTAMVGTPMYMPPEQIRGDRTIGPRTDVYAVGHIAFTLLTGLAYWSEEKRAFPALYTFLQTVLEGATEPATARAARRGVALAPAFDAWFARATARSPSDRFDRVSTLVQELRAVLNDAAAEPIAGPAWPSRSSPPPPPPATTGSTSSRSIAPASGRKRVRLALGIFAAPAFVALGIFAVLRWFDGGPKVTGSDGSATTTATPAPAPPPVSPPSVTPLETGAAVSGATAEHDAGMAVTPSIGKAAPRPAVRRPAPPAPPATDPCDPPYVLDGAGIRRMKPQCL